jgi:hypothetical protein
MKLAHDFANTRHFRFHIMASKYQMTGSCYMFVVHLAMLSVPLRRRWVDNIKMDLREVGWDGRDWIDLAQDRDRWRAYVNTVINLRVP